MITVLHGGGGLAKWLHYYIGVVRQMITLLHKGGVANDYDIPWILGFYIRNIISTSQEQRNNDTPSHKIILFSIITSGWSNVW